MRKRLYLAIIALAFVLSGNAQECDLCGTWTGVFKCFDDVLDNTTRRPYVRINKYGDKYMVRVKDVYTYNDDSSKTFYWDDCFGVYVNSNTIYWKSYSHKDDYWDGDTSNGKEIALAKYYKVCTATMDNGVLHFSETIEGDYFDSYGNKIGEHHQPWSTKDLYKDDENW